MPPRPLPSPIYDWELKDFRAPAPANTGDQGIHSVRGKAPVSSTTLKSNTAPDSNTTPELNVARTSSTAPESNADPTSNADLISNACPKPARGPATGAAKRFGQKLIIVPPRHRLTDGTVTETSANPRQKKVQKLPPSASSQNSPSGKALPDSHSYALLPREQPQITSPRKQQVTPPPEKEPKAHAHANELEALAPAKQTEVSTREEERQENQEICKRAMFGANNLLSSEAARRSDTSDAIERIGPATILK
jgi:hypothetical protein